MRYVSASKIGYILDSSFKLRQKIISLFQNHTPATKKTYFMDTLKDDIAYDFFDMGNIEHFLTFLIFINLKCFPLFLVKEGIFCGALLNQMTLTFSKRVTYVSRGIGYSTRLLTVLSLKFQCTEFKHIILQRSLGSMLDRSFRAIVGLSLKKSAWRKVTFLQKMLVNVF